MTTQGCPDRDTLPPSSRFHFYSHTGVLCTAFFPLLPYHAKYAQCQVLRQISQPTIFSCSTVLKRLWSTIPSQYRIVRLNSFPGPEKSVSASRDPPRTAHDHGRRREKKKMGGRATFLQGPQLTRSPLLNYAMFVFFFPASSPTCM